MSPSKLRILPVPESLNWKFHILSRNKSASSRWVSVSSPTIHFSLRVANNIQVPSSPLYGICIALRRKGRGPHPHPFWTEFKDLSSHHLNFSCWLSPSSKIPQQCAFLSIYQYQNAQYFELTNWMSTLLPRKWFTNSIHQLIKILSKFQYNY